MNDSEKQPHPIGCEITLYLAPAGARAMGEELLTRAREAEEKGELVDFTLGGEKPPMEDS